MERVDLSKLSNVVRNEVVKKTEYNKLVNKVNNIDTSGFLLKTKYAADKLELEKKIPDTSDLVKKLIIILKLLNQKTKFLILVIQQQKLHYLQLKIKLLILVIQSGKQITIRKLLKLRKKTTDHNHDRYIATTEYNT